MEHFARQIYQWLPLSLEQKTALRKFVSVHFGRVLLGWRKADHPPKEYFFGHPVELSSTEQLKKMITANYEALKLNVSPFVSIIIPVHNHVNFTVRCLLAISRAKTAAKYEIIVADDASDDETPHVLGNVEAIRYLRSADNMGFLNTCNLAAQSATGEYLVFLNNDTVVQHHWLDTLLKTFADFPGAGLVGSKLIYPDGRLQEAGGIVWKDGTGRNHGWGSDPNNPGFNYLREVDYCSGASIMIPHALWKQLDGFDETFAPAYYEDTDLAFQVRDAGYKVYYQPASEVIHFEGLSSGTDIGSGVKKHQEANRYKFVQKWKNILAKHEDNTSVKEHIFRSRYARARVLYIDSTTPIPNRDAGSVIAFQYMYLLKKLGCEVCFVPATDPGFVDPYTGELQRRGIECLYYPYFRNMDKLIKTRGNRYDIVILSRFTIASQYLDTILKHMSHARVIFNTIDLHFLREERAAQVSGSEKNFMNVDDVKQHELAIIQKVDHTLVVSETEHAILHDLLPDAQVSVIPIPGWIHGSSKGYEERCDIVFIGGYNHSPNVDAVSYFVKDVWPLIADRVSGARFLIVGSNMPSNFSKFASENVIVQGYVDDLDTLFDYCRLSVAPLRFGSGIKGKIITSLGYGVPCVATSIATEGMGLTEGYHILQADSPKDFANAVVEAYTNAELWHTLSSNGKAIVKEKFSLDIVEERLAAMLKSLDINGF